MAKFAETEARNFKGVFVCKVCKAKKKAPILKVLANKISCRKCSSKKLRPVRKK